MENFGYQKALKQVGISYLGKHSQSAKMIKNTINHVITYSLYLAPADMSGYNVCPVSKWCKQFCLNGSGRNKSDILARGFEHSHINRSRIKKTKLFFENNALFMQLLMHELEKTRVYAERNGFGFSVRLNCTSDISPEDFVDPDTGLNILQKYPDVVFYDYTKVPTRFSLIERYPNYHLTFSYNGHNEFMCRKFLAMGGNVAVVFANQSDLPLRFMGYDVIDGNKDDLRYLDAPAKVVGLHFHATAANYDKNGKYIQPNSDFVVRDDNELVEWF